jgi:hypothetical protein
VIIIIIIIVVIAVLLVLLRHLALGHLLRYPLSSLDTHTAGRHEVTCSSSSSTARMTVLRKARNLYIRAS